MLTYIYIPLDTIQLSSWLKGGKLLNIEPQVIIGYQFSNCFIVVEFAKDAHASVISRIDPDLKIIGYTNAKNVTNGSSELLYLKFDSLSRLPFLDSTCYSSGKKSTIVFFAPPNLRNLEYFTVRPILLHNTIDRESLFVPRNWDIFSDDSTDTHPLSICNESVLDKINGCSRVRQAHKALSSKGNDVESRSHLLTCVNHSSKLPRKLFMNVLLSLVETLMSLMVWISACLNAEVFHTTPVKASTWCRQLDLRLKQVSFFPFQFLSYYNTDFLSADIQAQLGIPVSNIRHNINNSNYINLYNTIWLMINDILIGRTILRISLHTFDENMTFFNDVLSKVSFEKLDEFITWIGSDYPAGFKLNNDLGQFMELLFSWTSQSCSRIFRFLVPQLASSTWFLCVVKLWFRLSCSLGVSFVLAFLIDYIRLATIHTGLFNLAATKIYHRQIEMLKSLMQLFRGRKYNVLRSRIDKIEKDQLRIDQLLLGTFVFLVLIYLLPTTFAFYFLFYAFRVALRTGLKMGEKVILCLNMYPLFVILLKLKNSKRLQGGVTFASMGRHETTDWFLMENKALTLEEICGNFIQMFRQEGRFERLVLNFAEGLDLQVKDTSSMKYKYLMLPTNHESLAKTWKAATRKYLE